jgi:transposase-like protein
MPKSKYPVLNDPEWLRAQYALAGANTIALEVGCSAATVRQALRRHGIRLRPGTVTFSFSAWTDHNILAGIAEAGTIRKFAKIHGMAQTTVIAEMRRRGLNVDNVQAGNWRACRSGSPCLTDAEIADAANRHAQGQSVDSIAATYGVASVTMRRTLRLYGHSAGRPS